MRDRKQMLLRAMSASRQQSSREFLLRLVQTGRSADCLDALEALALHKGSAEVREEVERAVAQRGEDDMQALFNEMFRHSG
jgi:hypothetical protein